jgi:hypothetical protein
VDDSFTIICHKTNEGRVPFIDDFGEGGRARTHQNLTDAVIELLDAYSRCVSDCIGPMN